ncbi:LysR family transcriptional regulator [Sediminitomix flava]|uniref:DNA-binding transcriptional LysR family regulator n=1 Tax=Sediminitomix flava TaxID=379075 RepID=A0A315Z6Y4_SEDFL|nr:LysR family transcriptional regulator [Sediminitomix flava]PWJ39165.1 DNA-binding transcriptional LysR family regulator [Sediminitomix flava]
MNLQFIKYFVALAETQNFTQASDKVHVVQSTFSTGIKKLEEHLGCQLFFRDRRNVSLTKEGEILLPKAKSMLSIWNSMETEFAHETIKELNIGVLNTLDFDTIVPKMKAFKELHSGCKVNLIEGDHEYLSSKLQRNELDGYFSKAIPEEEQLEHCVVSEDKLMIGVPDTHPLAMKDKVELNALHKISFIKRCNCSLFKEVSSAFEEKQIEPDYVFTANGDDTALALVASGIGVSLLPKPRKENVGVKFLPITDANFKRKITFVWKKGNHSKALMNFRSA